MKYIVILAFLLLPFQSQALSFEFSTEKVDFYCGKLVASYTVAQGCYVPATEQIFIREGMSGEKVRFVSLHEYGHHLLRKWTLADYQKVWGKGMTLRVYQELSADMYANYREGVLFKLAGKNVWNMVRGL